MQRMLARSEGRAEARAALLHRFDRTASTRSAVCARCGAAPLRHRPAREPRSGHPDRSVRANAMTAAECACPKTVLAPRTGAGISPRRPRAAGRASRQDQFAGRSQAVKCPLPRGRVDRAARSRFDLQGGSSPAPGNRLTDADARKTPPPARRRRFLEHRLVRMCRLRHLEAKLGPGCKPAQVNLDRRGARDLAPRANLEPRPGQKDIRAFADGDSARPDYTGAPRRQTPI